MKELYQPSATEVVTIIVPEMQFLMIDGMGSPGEAQDYLDALAVLYPIAFKTKFLSKAKGKDYVVPPLEGLWWADDMNDFTSGNRDKWKWTMMIMQPLKNSRPGCVPPPTLLSRSGDQTLKSPPPRFFCVNIVTIEGVVLACLGGLFALAWPGALYGARGPVQTSFLSKVTVKEHSDSTKSQRMRDVLLLGLLGLTLIGIDVVIGILFT